MVSPTSNGSVREVTAWTGGEVGPFGGGGTPLEDDDEEEEEEDDGDDEDEEEDEDADEEVEPLIPPPLDEAGGGNDELAPFPPHAAKNMRQEIAPAARTPHPTARIRTRASASRSAAFNRSPVPVDFEFCGNAGFGRTELSLCSLWMECRALGPDASIQGATAAGYGNPSAHRGRAKIMAAAGRQSQAFGRSEPGCAQQLREV
jgi:hypothetical protein